MNTSSVEQSTEKPASKGVDAAASGSALLFPLAEIESKSPRLLWIEAHGIKTLRRDDLPSDVDRWEAYVGEYEQAVDKTLNDSEANFYPDASPHLAWGEDEEEAIMRLAENNGWPLWQNTGMSHGEDGTQSPRDLPPLAP